MTKFEGKVAVVTGGERGLGRAIVQALLAHDAKVIVLDRDPGADFGNPQPVARLLCDVSDEASVVGAFAEIDRIAGTPDILVNSAGIAIRGPAAEFTLKDWNQVIAVNLTGAFLCAREAGRRMIAAGGGSIVNIASVMGFSGGIFPNVAYQTSKGGIVNLTRALAVEWAASGIRVNAVAPTYVETDLTRQLLARPDAKDRILALTPMRALATPEQVAAAVLFLAGPDSAMTTGHCLPVDGGFLAL